MARLRSVLFVSAVGMAACRGDAPDSEQQQPPQTLRGGLGSPCGSQTLNVCVGPYTGPSCSFECDGGSGGGGDGGTTIGGVTAFQPEGFGTTGGPPEGCDYRVYCHDDESLYGIAVFNAHLFDFSPTDTAPQITSAFETFVTLHEADLGLAAGLSTSDLSFAPADNFVVEQGQLWLYRFVQKYPLPGSVEVPLIDASALLTLEADNEGAVTLKGTVVDTRIAYTNRSDQASAILAESSIIEHTSVQTGIDPGDIEVQGLQLVAVPSLQRVAWYGIPSAGAASLARVLVDADPQEEELLDLLRYDDGDAEGLLNTSQISVRTQDLSASDPWADPASESVETTRADGQPLLGSVLDGNNEVQLGTTEVVVLDLLGGSFDIDDETDFERYTDAMGEFELAQPNEQFQAQRLYHLVQSGYAAVDRVALGKWDSAVQAEIPSLTSDFDPGTYRPRIIVGYNHASTGASGAANRLLPGPGNPQSSTDPEAFFPEEYHRPDPINFALQNEVVATMKLGLGLTQINTVLHEAGHNFDYFLGPRWSSDYAPEVCGTCAEGCDEDTTDEAWPLRETIAQMFALWQLKRLSPGLEHDTCDLMSHMEAGGTTNNRIVHSPGCMTQSDEIGLFIRDDDPACLDTSVCDKPYRDGAPGQGGSKRCRTTDGYNTFSILQAWWNALHGLYCEPTFPFTCTSVAVTWPPGCDQMGSPVECVTPEDAAGLAFLYALRSNPLTYVDFFDSMARFVSCNYGAAAYADFNQALCEHEIRSCTEPPPSDCEVCGNGIREGGEQCDGTDLSIDELGYVPGCTDLDFMGGVLGCTPQCTYDDSQCVSPPDKTGGGESSSEDGGSAEDSGGTGTNGGADGGAGDGCGCASGGTGGGLPAWMIAAVVLATAGRRRRRGRRVLGPAAVLIAIVGTSACGDDRASSGGASGASESTSDTGTGDTASRIPGWPEAWFGEYHTDNWWLEFGQPYEFLTNPLPDNLFLESDRATVDTFSCAGRSSVQTYRVVFEPDSAFLLPEHDGEELIWLSPGHGLERIILRPSETCDGLEVVLDYGDSLEGDTENRPSTFVTPFIRGQLCVIDSCEDVGLPGGVFILDYCPDAVRECENPTTDSN